MTDIDVAIIGGGISGLSAARALCARGLTVRLFERERACGGVIQTDCVDGFVIDTGPDTLLAHKPAALDLVRELGLGSGLVRPLPRRTTYVLKRSALRSLPETSAMGLPTDWKTVVGAHAFSWLGKLRMAAEALVPPSPPVADESIASFVRRRFGREAVTYVAEPVLAGIHRGEAARLSMQALFPFLAEAERRHGSVARAWRRTPAREAAGGSMSLRGGLGQVAAQMQAELPPDVAVADAEVEAIERCRVFELRLRSGISVSARAVIVATPAYATGTLTAGLDPELSTLCRSIRYVPSVTVALGYRRDDVRHPLQGWGFMVPAADRRRVRSASWVSSKWPDRAPAGHALLRASLAAGASTLDAPDRTLAAWAHDDLAPLLAIRGAPTLTRVCRRPQAMPQLEVGHIDRISAIERRLASIPGLFISASGFRGIGLPDCIADARRTAQDAVDYLAARRSSVVTRCS